MVIHCSVDDFIEEIRLAEDIFRHTKPKTEELFSGANQHMILLFNISNRGLVKYEKTPTGVEQIM